MLKWIVLSVVLDRITKELVVISLMPGESVDFLGGFLRLTHVTNAGAAFGMLSDHTSFLAAISLALIGAIIWWYARYVPHSERGLGGVAAGLLIGGATGNLIDRVLRGYVIDFFDLGFWPVFNVADIAVVVGCGLVFLLVLRNPESIKGGISE